MGVAKLMTRPLSLILSLILLLSLCGLTAFASLAPPREDGPTFDGTNYRRRNARRTRRHKPRSKRAVVRQQQQQPEPKLEQITLPSSPTGAPRGAGAPANNSKRPSFLYDDDDDERSYKVNPSRDIKPPMGKPGDIKPPMKGKKGDTAP